MWTKAIYDIYGASVIKYSFINYLEVLGSGYFVITIVWTVCKIDLNLILHITTRNEFWNIQSF